MLSKYFFLSFQPSKSTLLLGGAIVFLWKTPDIWCYKKFSYRIFPAFWFLWLLKTWMTCWLRPSQLCRQPMLKAAQEQYWFSRAHQKLPLLIYISFTPKGTNPTRFQFPNFANSLKCSTMDALYMITWLWLFLIIYLHIGANWGPFCCCSISYMQGNGFDFFCQFWHIKCHYWWIHNFYCALVS